MKVAIIGYGKQSNKIIDYLLKLKKINKIVIFKKSKFKFKNHFNKNIEYKNNLGTDEIFDCTFICSPNGTHIGYIKIFINYSKYIFCEKPGPTDKKDLKYLKSLKTIKKKRIYFNYNYLFTNYFKDISKELRNKKNGKLINFSFFASHGIGFKRKMIKKKDHIFNNILGNLGVHYLNFLFANFKKISIIKSHDLKIAKKNKDTSFIYLKADRIFGNLFLSYASVLYKFAILHFTNCVLIFDNHNLKKYSPRDYFAKSGLFATPPVKIISNNGINDISRSLNFSLNYFFRTVEKKKLFSLKKFNLALLTSRLLIK